jgi:hypothetical protein
VTFDLRIVDEAHITDLAAALRSSALNDACACPRCAGHTARLIDSARWSCNGCSHRGTLYELQHAVKQSAQALSRFFGVPFAGEPIAEAGPYIPSWLGSRAQRDRPYREQAFIDDLMASEDTDWAGTARVDKARRYMAKYGQIALVHALGSAARFSALPPGLDELWDEIAP